MKPTTLLFFLTAHLFCISSELVSAQTARSAAERVLSVNKNGYSFSGIMEDRIISGNWTSQRVELTVFDTLMNKTADKRIDLDLRHAHSILDIIFSKNDFTIIDYTERNNIRCILLSKYDTGLRLIDTARISFAAKHYDQTTAAFTLSEDKKMLLIYEKEKAGFMDLCAINLEALKKNWVARFDYKPIPYVDNAEQLVIGNAGDAFLFLAESPLNEKNKRIVLTRFDKFGQMHDVTVPPDDFYLLNIKMSVDNLNQKVCVVGVYTQKNNTHALGTLNFMSPIATDTISGIIKHPFDDAFASAFTGKKVTDTKGLSFDLRVREIIHNRDGGMTFVVEDIEERLRNTNVGGILLPEKHFAFNNLFITGTNTGGEAIWRTVVTKNQTSVNDNGRFSSYFILKTPSALNIIFNNEIGLSTIISRYVVRPDGRTSRGALMNTDGKNMRFCFRDALQTKANEVLVPIQTDDSVGFVRLKL